MDTLPRLVEPALAERLRVMPAVVLTRARRTGKSTLVSECLRGERCYASFGARYQGALLPRARLDSHFSLGPPDRRQ